MNNSYVELNTASSFAALIVTNGYALVYNSTFVQHAGVGFFRLNFLQGQAQFNNCTFTNTGTAGGKFLFHVYELIFVILGTSAIYATGGTVAVVISHCTFTGMSITSTGGAAIYFSAFSASTSLVVSDCSFFGNKYSGDGGGMHLSFPFSFS